MRRLAVRLLLRLHLWTCHWCCTNCPCYDAGVEEGGATERESNKEAFRD